MNTSSLDNRVLSLFVAAMLALFCSMAFEANRNGMTDPVVAVREVPKTAVAVVHTTAETHAVVAQNSLRQPR